MFLRVLCPRLYSAPLLQKPKQQSSQTSAFPVRFTTTCPSRVALPIYRVGADTELSSQRPIQSLAYETSSSAVIPYTSSAYSHIQNSGLASCLYEIEGTQAIVRADVFSLVIKGFLTLHFNIAFWKPNKKRQQSVPHKAPESRQTPAVRFAYLGMNLTYIKEIQSQQKG